MSTGRGELEGKVAVVTGAGSGLGLAAATAFAEAGAAVVCNDIDGAAAQAAADGILASGGQAAPHAGDVSQADDVAALVAVAVDRFGGLDVMHANAAISIYADLETCELDDFHRILDVNLKGPLLCARAAIPALRARGGGSITFVSSVQGFQGLPGCVAYAAAKAGLVAAARTLATEVGRIGIRVNAIAPGTIDTPMLQRDLAPMNPEQRADFMGRVNSANTLGRVGRPEEIGEAALYLASDRSGYVTGTCLTVDGGFLAVKAF